MSLKDWDLAMQSKIMHKLNNRGRNLITREASMENKANIIVRFLSIAAHVTVDIDYSGIAYTYEILNRRAYL